MRWVAEYAMRGRLRAIIVTLLCGFIPLLYFVSAAVVGLVNLRKGGYEGFLILLWSLLPAGLLWQMGDATPAFLMLGAAVLSQLLRRTASWQQVLVVACVLGILVQASLAWQTGYVQELQAVVSQAFEGQTGQGAEEVTAEQLVNLMLRFYGAYHVIAMILCLMLARWWQAALYNPGGFRTEFHQLRIEPRVAAVFLGLIAVGLLGVPPVDGWLPILSIPPMFGGLAVIHGVVALKKLGGPWLMLGYLTLVMVSPAVISLGLVDSFVDFRKRVIKTD